jgi:hypothetical protein
MTLLLRHMRIGQCGPTMSTMASALSALVHGRRAPVTRDGTLGDIIDCAG